MRRGTGWHWKQNAVFAEPRGGVHDIGALRKKS